MKKLVKYKENPVDFFCPYRQRASLMSNIASSIGTYLHDLFLKLFTEITGVSTAVWKSIEPILKSEVGQLYATALPYATSIITQIATGELTANKSGSEKFSLAVDQLKTALVSQAKVDAATVTATALNTIVQNVYTSLSSQGIIPSTTGATPTPTAPVTTSVTQ